MLELDVHTNRGHDDRSAVAVIAGIRDEGESESVVEATPGMQVVVALQYVLATVVQFPSPIKKPLPPYFK